MSYHEQIVGIGLGEIGGQMQKGTFLVRMAHDNWYQNLSVETHLSCKPFKYRKVILIFVADSKISELATI